MTSRAMRVLLTGLAVTIAIAAMAHPTMAAVSTPEIDGSSFTAGLGLLTAGVLMLRARRRR